MAPSTCSVHVRSNGVQRCRNPKLQTRVVGIVARPLDRSMRAMHLVDDCTSFVLRAKRHAVDEGHGGTEAVQRPVGEVTVVFDALTDAGHGNL